MAKETSILDYIRDLEMGRLSWIIQIGPVCNHKDAKKVNIGSRRREKRKGGWSEMRKGHELKNAGTPETRKGQEIDSLLEPPEGPSSANTLTLNQRS